MRFVRRPAKHLLAVRHVGSYDEPFAPPYLDGDVYWTGLVAWAEARGIGYSPLPYGFYLDMPGITPEAVMRADFCIEIDRAVADDGRYFHVPFAGGTFGVIEHRGSYSTLPRAYRALVDTVVAQPGRYVPNGEPPFQILHHVHVGGDPDDNVTEVYFPVDRR